MAVNQLQHEIASRRSVTACAIGLIVLATLATSAWVVSASPVTSVFPGWVRLDPTSAFLFLTSGFALLARSYAVSFSRTALLAASGLMLLVGTTKGIGYLLEHNVSADRFLYWSNFGYSGAHQGSGLAPNTSLCFVLMGFALAVFSSSRGKAIIPSAAVIVALTVGIASFVGFAFTTTTSASLGPYAPMAFPMNLCFLMLGTAAIALRPDTGIAKLFTDKSIGSVLVRRLLPVVVLAPFVISIVRLLAVHHGLLPSAVATALAIVITILFIVYLIISTAIMLNISDARRQHAEQQMQILAEQLREEATKSKAANQSKSLFLANMSHEIRTPINGVLGTSEILSMRDLDPEVRKLVGIVRASGETLLRVINDILDFSKIEAGKLEIERTPCNLSILVNDIVVLYQAQAEARGISMSVDIPEKDPPIASADPVRIKQILANLISNAIKFTSSGEVRVALEFTEIDENRIQAMLSVKDTGIGIPVDRQSVIFDHFTQVDESTHRRFGGTGLGLAICKRLVELMGGDITLTSQAGHGSIFVVRLELPTVKAGDEKVIPLEPIQFPSGRRFLLAEDNEVNAMVATALLESLGCSVHVVGDGLSAIAAVASKQFDAVLMDIHMPICDGLEATRTIRQIPDVANIKIIALTASALSEDRRACLEAGIDGFLSKPFTRDGLVAALTSDQFHVL